tara:strand:+ start:224 stop:562 length:339 start_codon:yes stop_codon:yes gene_type:complete
LNKKENMVFAVCYSYDKNFVNGNAPTGIMLYELHNKCNDYNEALEYFRQALISRQTMDEDYGCGYSREFRLCLLELDDNDETKIKNLLATDLNRNNFWDEQIKLHQNILKGH